MNKREAVIIGAYTGILMGEFSDLHKYIEKILDRPVFTHELASKELNTKIRELAKPEFLTICSNLEE